MKQTLKKLLSLVLVVALFTSIVPTHAFAAEETEVYLPEIQLGSDILDYDVFYLATASATVQEDGHNVYLLRVGRGGPADSESTVLVKIADLTAKYGEDYVVRVHDERTKVDNPEGNFSLMELIEDSDFEQGELGTEEELAEMLENDPEAQAAYREGTETALDFLDEASGLKEKYADENPYSEALEELYGEDATSDAYSIEADVEAIPANGDGEIITIGGAADEYEDVDPVQAAANLFTGESATAQRLTSEGDMFQDLQAIANVMTNAVVGASVELTFAPGETEKYLEIVPKDNKTGDGDRMFYIILGVPSGTTTNSAASTCAFTIVDDEEQEPAVVSFSDAFYGTTGDSVTVTVERSGAMNTVISVKVKTTGEGTAQAGRDYSEVDAELVFPFGISHLSINIPVRTEYLSGSGDFALALEPTAGCTVGENATATVYLDGSYTGKASLMMAQNTRTLNASSGGATLMASGSGGDSDETPTNTNNLSTYATFDAIDLSKPLSHGTVGSSFSGKDHYVQSGDYYETMWKGKGKGTVGVVYELTDNMWDSYFIAGAQVKWNRSYGCGNLAWMKVALSGKNVYSNNNYPFDFAKDADNKNNGYWYPYDSNRKFDSETQYFYPHADSIESWSGIAGTWPGYKTFHGSNPQAIEILNVAMCDDCSWLHIEEIKPIKKPWQVNVRDADPLTYLQADGTRVADTKAVTAKITDAGTSAVYFKDDSFSAYLYTVPGITQYGYLAGLAWADATDYWTSFGDALLVTNDDPSVNSLTWTLNSESLHNMAKRLFKEGADEDDLVTLNLYLRMVRENPYMEKKSAGTATYMEFNVKPVLDYVDCEITLRNPYDFPVTMTICGTDYVLAAKETRKIQTPDGQAWHKGDYFSVDKITMGAEESQLYTPVSVHYDGKGQTTATKPSSGTVEFKNGQPASVPNTGDFRLDFSEITIEPVLQEKDNCITVRVKTDELAMFDRTVEKDKNGNITKTAGLLAQTGVVDGDYTVFTFTDTDSTVNGMLYAINVTPLDGMVATWYDANTLRTYVGNTLYFTAGADAVRNTITLSASAVRQNVTLEGTLYYTNYNLRTGVAGNASNVPAVGAALAAGSAGGVANAKGFVSAGPIPITGFSNQYLRYIVSINGFEAVKELLLPTADVGMPTMLWDFGSDNAMSAKMGANLKARVDYAGEKDGSGNDYYVFTSTNGKDPYVSVDVSASGVDSIQWVKIRARNLSGADVMEFFACTGSNTKVYGSSNVQIPLEQDTEWHEYLVHIPEKSSGWTERINWFRLDPMDGNLQAGSQVQIDYIAFFSEEADASAFTDTGSGSLAIDISENFSSGVSPVGSDIFQGITITGVMSDKSYHLESGQIPVVLGKSANMTVAIKPQTYSYSYTDENGQIVEDSRNEMPLSVQFVVYDQNDVFRGAFEPTDSLKYKNKAYNFTSSLEFVEPEEVYELRVHKDAKGTVFYVNPDVNGDYLIGTDGKKLLDDQGKPFYVNKDEKGYYFTEAGVRHDLDSGYSIYVNHDADGTVIMDNSGKPIEVDGTAYGLIPQPGDKLYLRLVTDRLAQTENIRVEDLPIEIPPLEEDEEIVYDETIYEGYQYTDIFTGMSFYQPVAYAMPAPIQLDKPIEIEYGNLPLVGSTGMDLAFPFVSIGIMHIYHGYRIYFGVSPVQIADTIKGTHMSSMSGSDGQYWKDLFSIKHPFDSFFGGLSEASQQISEFKEAAKAAKANKETFSTSNMGSPSWKFDLSIGMYFDFLYATVTQEGKETNYFKLNGLGGYVSVTLGFQFAWYFVVPVVFLPGYIGIDMQGTVMGYLGATFNDNVTITYDGAYNGNQNISDGIIDINGGIRGSGFVQLSAGIGLCGTLGIRAAGKVSMIANWEPTDPNGSWGFYVAISAGLIIDLFLFSIPLMYTFPGWPFGSFEYYSNPEKWTTTPSNPDGKSSTASTLSLRAGSEYDSTWLGDQMLLMGAFRPNKDQQKLLVADAYERPDSQLITLSDGETLVLAFVDSDNVKGAAQRTTLKMATYAGGQWSELVTVSGDNTADFQPSIAETKDGKVLVAWVSPTDTSADLSTDEGVMTYLNSMEVYSAFVELDSSKRIKTKTDAVYGICADTEVIRITNDHYTRANGTVSSYYDSNPTVVCDMESGDAMVYYIKSGRSSLGDGQITDYINPYTNDCVVCYMPYNAEADTDTDGRTVPAGWLFNNFYYAEMGGNTTNEQMLINNFGGQRFLDGAVNANNERYTIPDFTAIGYNGLAIYAYTVDKDGSNDTDSDKELYLQVYDFRNHETKYKILLTDDDVADAMPQFFRSKVNSDGYSTDAENTHTKLFWYRDGKNVVYIDVTALLRDGINTDGTLKTEANDPNHEYTYVENGKTHYRFTDPRIVFVPTADSNASAQFADFKAVEDSEGNLYILWTETVTDEDGNAAREIFGSGLVEYEDSYEDENGNTVTYTATSGWSKPYRITRDGWNNDEMAVAMTGENLMVVHNRFHEELVEVDADAEYAGQVDFTPLVITDLGLVADTLEPCGSMEPESISLYRVTTGTMTDESGGEIEINGRAPVTLPVGGEAISIEVEVANNGMNIADGYKLSLYAGETLIKEIEVTDALAPNTGAVHYFDYVLPANVDGLTFKAVAQEMRDAVSKQYYNDKDEFVTEPLEAKAAYEITAVETYQAEDGFHAKVTVTNTGNTASSSGDKLSIKLRGPANLADQFTEEEVSLYSKAISLGVGESKEFDVPVNILPKMMEEYGFVNTLITVQKEVVEQTINGHNYMGTRILSNLVYADFDLLVPMEMSLQDVTVEIDESADIVFSMNLGDQFRGGDDVTFAVDDLTVARVDNGKVVGVNGGTTTLHATHAATGANTSATVTVTGEREVVDLEIAPTSMNLSVGDTGTIEYNTTRDGEITWSTSDASVATIDVFGTVTAVGAGTAVITVTLIESGTGKTNTATCTVTVTDNGTEDTVTVTFNANGGTGSMSPQTITVGEATALTANAFRRSGYSFAGWNTEANGSGTAYRNRQTVTLTVDMTLYAQWEEYPDDPTPTPPADTITVEVTGDEGSITVSATISGNTATITAPTEAQIAEITDRAGETGAVTIDLSSLPENITAVVIPAETIRAIDEAMEDNGEGLTIKLPNSTVTFDAAALASVAAQTTGDNLKLNVEPVDETALSSSQREAIAELEVQAIFDIYLTSGDKRITDFGDGKATVEVKHQAKTDQQPSGFVVWYAAEDGTIEKNPTSATKETVKFIVTHFSDYVVAYDKTLPGACDRGETCPMSAFDDLDKTLWYHDGVHWALENEIMNGYGGGKFGPNDTTNRAMIVTMLHRFEGEPAVDYDMDFTDVEDGKWYTEAIRWAAVNGIVTGYGDGRFGPNDVLTREQLATILYRYAKLKGHGFTGMWAFPLTFDDAPDVSDWAYEAMCWMTMNGVINGVGNNKLSPKGSATRAQVATMLMRYEAIEQ